MSSSDVGLVVGAVHWGDEGSYVREVAARGPLPQLAKVIKGQYLGVGVPSLANPGLASTLLLLSAGRSLRIAAQSVKFKEGRRVVPIGPKLAIPESYDGYFEILSEDGRAVRCMETVAELTKRFPDSCLVRDNIKAYVSRSDDVETITEKSRTVQAGETLVLVGEVIGTKTSSKIPHRFLRCFDQAGQNVYMPYDSKGKFSAIAKEDHISGVHSIKNLLQKRLPLMVRMVHGRPPVGLKSASQFMPELRLFAAFDEEPLAALPLGKDTPLVLLPPQAPLKLAHARNADQVEKSKEFMRLCERATNLMQDVSTRIYVYDISIGNKGGMRDPRFNNWPEQNKQRHKHHRSHNHHHRSSAKTTAETTKGSSSTGGLPDDYDEIDQIYDYVRGFAPLPKHIKSPYSTDDPTQIGKPSVPSSNNRRSTATYHSPMITPERSDSRPTPPPIETIPTRRGAPPMEKLSPSVHPALISAALDRAAERRVEKRSRRPDEKKESSRSSSNIIHQSPIQQTKSPLQPVSPYVNLQEYHQNNKSSSNNKLFVKASQQKAAKARMFRHKSASPVKEALMEVVSVGPGGLGSTAGSGLGLSPGSVIPGAGSGSSPSPLFKLRYKSLTNLAMDFDTLDSSTSGGKTSADSGGSTGIKAKLPEKRSRKLPRPKSLTNLVWDGRGSGGSVVGDGPLLGMGGPVSGGAARALLEAERKLRLEPGVYRHARDAPALLAATSRLLASQKKIGTLYL
ncbi:unnamed protein product [Meganyctiphanes norvegica]|uniref:CABIT domain-containing protein n=1 Tax=Meganyctiphanes norvegica TaxID=48144 RepID=A0AAV2PU77_MEGNR